MLVAPRENSWGGVEAPLAGALSESSGFGGVGLPSVIVFRLYWENLC